METKEELVANIKEWIKNDTEISTLQKELKIRRNNKKMLTREDPAMISEYQTICYLTLLHFEIWKGQVKLDPESWLF